MLLNELGFDENFLTPLRDHYISAITSILYPDWGGASLDSHKAFVVKYKLGEDTDLTQHYSDAKINVNGSLRKSFTGGE